MCFSYIECLYSEEIYAEIFKSKESHICVKLKLFRDGGDKQKFKASPKKPGVKNKAISETIFYCIVSQLFVGLKFFLNKNFGKEQCI